VHDGSYAACTRVQNNQTFTVNSGETITIYTTLARCNTGNAGTTISFANAQAADTTSIAPCAGMEARSSTSEVNLIHSY
jgi:hypothetical protein